MADTPVTPTPIGSWPTPPQRTDAPATFVTRADAWVAATPTRSTEMNALATNVNYNAESAFESAAEAAADAVTAAAAAASADATANAELWVSGTTYEIGRNVYSPINFLTYRRKVAGAGTTDPSLDATNWANVIPSASAGDHQIELNSGNGYGSTNTKIRRFTTVQSNVGTAMTYTDSAANGASVTINEDGLYGIYYLDTRAAATTYIGASVNSTELTTDIASIAAADRLMACMPSANGVTAAVSKVVRLSTGDIIRPHTNSASTATAVESTVFSVVRVGV